MTHQQISLIIAGALHPRGLSFLSLRVGIGDTMRIKLWMLSPIIAMVLGKLLHFLLVTHAV